MTEKTTADARPVMRLFDRRGVKRPVFVWVCPECSAKEETRSAEPPRCSNRSRSHVRWGKAA